MDAMARIGYLYLRGGTWDGTPIMSASFVAEATTLASSIMGLTIYDPVNFPNATSHYGLLWWNNNQNRWMDFFCPSYCEGWNGGDWVTRFEGIFHKS